MPPTLTSTPKLAGRVVEISRRFVTVITPKNTLITGTLSSKSLDFVVGDLAAYDIRGNEIFITSSTPASRCLYRTFNGRLRRMGANIDALCVITAPGPTWNAVAIDRMLAAATVQSIPTTLIINKSDLDLSEIQEMIDIYSKLGVRLIVCSAKSGVGIADIRAVIEEPCVAVAALCGVSGVGKSSILNCLIPSAKTRTGEVSERTGQGRQTTSQPRGFVYPSSTDSEPALEPKIVIDLPGVQFFGLAHLAERDVIAAFSEIQETGLKCRFRDCAHVKERSCAVRVAVESGDIARWRYQSYLQILDEIKEAKEY